MLSKLCTPEGIKKTSYSTFESAINDCQKDYKCIGIHEENCDRQEKYNMCEEIDKISNGVVPSSCIYMKDQGKLFKMIVFQKINIIFAIPITIIVLH